LRDLVLGLRELVGLLARPGGKSARFDAFVQCELARPDSHRFRVLVPDDGDQTKALRALTRAREDLVGTRVALANQLRAELKRFWPGAAVIFKDIDSPISLAFIERYPNQGELSECAYLIHLEEG
jgi:hypothetical protein